MFAPAGHPLAKRNAITLREASAFDLILPTRDSSVRETVEAIAHRERLALQTRYETNFMPTALAFVRVGLGIVQSCPSPRPGRKRMDSLACR